MAEMTGNDSEARRFANQLNDLAEKALDNQETEWTDFLEPSQLAQAQALLGWNTRVRYRSYGGYPGSERQRMVVYPDYYLAETIQPKTAYLEIVPSNPEELSHRDYLGALLALGLKREKIGDLLLTKTGCQVIFVPELVPFLLTNLKQVGKQSVNLRTLDAEELAPPTQKQKEIRTTVASLRLDALAACGAGESRTKMAREIRAERVKVNWRIVTNPDQQLNPGDIISIRGRGRIVFQEQTGRSKKGRLGVVLVRYL